MHNETCKKPETTKLSWENDWNLFLQHIKNDHKKESERDSKWKLYI